MRYIGWAIRIGFWVILAAFLHYTLPQRDIVRIVSTEVQRQELADWTRMFWSTPDSQSTGLINRDVQFIQTVYANGSLMVFRNEDTGWRWPPYFKFDTANLYTEAADLVSTREEPKWLVMTHYGWRSEMLSIYPNAISIRAVSGPDAAKGIPWTNIIVLTLLAAVFYGIWVRWRRFRQKHIDPRLEEWQDNVEAASDTVTQSGGRLKRWFGWR